MNPCCQFGIRETPALHPNDAHFAAAAQQAMRPSTHGTEDYSGNLINRLINQATKPGAQANP